MVSTHIVGGVHKSVTLNCEFILVQLDMCAVVCGSLLSGEHSSDGCLRFRFALSWATIYELLWGVLFRSDVR